MSDISNEDGKVRLSLGKYQLNPNLTKHMNCPNCFKQSECNVKTSVGKRIQYYETIKNIFTTAIFL